MDAKVQNARFDVTKAVWHSSEKARWQPVQKFAAHNVRDAIARTQKCNRQHEAPELHGTKSTCFSVHSDNPHYRLQTKRLH